jgi:hypothetical protein
MAERFGGKYSPQGSQSGHTPMQSPIRAQGSDGQWRTTVLFLSAFLFLFPAFGDGPRDLLFGLSAGGALILAAWLTREGIKAETEYNTRTLARRPALPRKLFGAAITGIALFLGGMTAGIGLIYPVLFALVGVGLHLGAFGLDPMRDKGMEGIDAFQTGRVAHAVEEGEAYLAGMTDAILRAGDRSLEKRVDQFTTQRPGKLFRTDRGRSRRSDGGAQVSCRSI